MPTTLLIEMEDKMQKVRFGVVVLWILLCSVTSAPAQVSIGIGLPNVSIGINLPLFPELVPVPGYPVYYAPRLDANYFFYDGMYWVFLDDTWYSSYWYNGPWWLVEPQIVPVFILRIPVRYYRHPPVYFRGWRSDAPPRWGEHWGRGWERHRRGWDRWNRGSAPARAPLPLYQRQYSGDRYPRQVEHQQTLHRQNYRYQPRDKAVREHFQQREERRAPGPGQRERREERMRGPGQQEIQRPAPHQQQRGPALQERREQREQPGGVQRERQEPRPQGREQRLQEREKPQETRPQGRERKLQERPQEPGRGEGQRREEERGREHQ